jgi:sorbitol/mannitol transport system permease protein
LAYLIYGRALLQFDIGGAAAGGVIAVILANLVTALLARTIASQLDA